MGGGTNEDGGGQRLRHNLEVEINNDKNNYCPPSIFPPSTLTDLDSIMESDRPKYLCVDVCACVCVYEQTHVCMGKHMCVRELICVCVCVCLCV